MKFGLSLMDQLKEQLLAAKDHASIFALLRLEAKSINRDIIRSILDKSKDIKLDEFDFPALRKEAYDKNLKASLEASARAAQKDAEAAAQKKKEKQRADDDDDSDDDSEDSDGEGEECQSCHDMVPEFFCRECKLKLCEDCHKKPKDAPQHKSTHKTIMMSDYNSDEEQVTKKMENLKV